MHSESLGEKIFGVGVASFATFLAFFLTLIIIYSTYIPFRLYYTGELKKDRIKNLSMYKEETDLAVYEFYKFTGDSTKKKFVTQYTPQAPLKEDSLVNVFISPLYSEGIYLSHGDVNFIDILLNSVNGNPFLAIFLYSYTFYYILKVTYLRMKVSILLVYNESKKSLIERDKYLSILHHIKNFLPFSVILSFTYAVVFMIIKAVYFVEKTNQWFAAGLLVICFLGILFLPYFMSKLSFLLSNGHPIVKIIKQTGVVILSVYGTYQTVNFFINSDFESFENLTKFFEEFFKSLLGM